MTGLIDIEDESGIESRVGRTKLACQGINEQKGRLVEDLNRLITAVSTLSSLLFSIAPTSKIMDAKHEREDSTESDTDHRSSRTISKVRCAKSDGNPSVAFPFDPRIWPKRTFSLLCQSSSPFPHRQCTISQPRSVRAGSLSSSFGLFACLLIMALERNWP